MEPQLKYPESPVVMLYFACECEPPEMVEDRRSGRSEYACWKCRALGVQMWLN